MIRCGRYRYKCSKMKENKYNYVVFNVIESKMHPSHDGYYNICLRDLNNLDGVEPVYYPLSHKPLWMRFLYNVHNIQRINLKCKLPFRYIWWPHIAKCVFNNNKPICFVFLGIYPLEYIKYLKNKYADCRFVLIYRDLRRVVAKYRSELIDHPIFDLQMSIDRVECEKYGMVYFHEFESKIDIPISKNYPESDVFFAGKVKDRLPRLIEAYNIFTKAGLKCKYYLTGVPLEQRISLEGVEYADKPMSYKEMLYHTVNSRCVFEINQADAVGFTSRFLEAVMYNKRLITDNKDVMQSKFYNGNNILCIRSMKDITPSFVLKEDKVDYNYCGEFSPIHLIEQIDSILANKLIR